jgi:hypothetical protein
MSLTALILEQAIPNGTTDICNLFVNINYLPTTTQEMVSLFYLSGYIIYGSVVLEELQITRVLNTKLIFKFINLKALTDHLVGGWRVITYSICICKLEARKFFYISF